MTTNAELAGATLGHLAGLGVKDFVVCAGARNAPLVTSLLKVSEKEGFTIWHHFDERAASFFSLGLAKRKGEPVAVLTTSGTAVAELLPAAVEAYYSGIPLILVTADRPVAYRGSGAPQAIEQPGIFGHYTPVAIDVKESTDLSWVLKWEGTEPMHLNVCIEEPDPDDRVHSLPEISLPPIHHEPSHDDRISLEAFVAKPRELVVLLGELPNSWRPNVELFLAELGAPVWAEATSGLRESGLLGDLLLSAEQEVSDRAPQEILRIGGVPSLRFWRDLETHRSVEVFSISRRPFSGLARTSRHLCTNEFPDMSGWEDPWKKDSRDTRQGAVTGQARLNDLLSRHSTSEPAMIGALSEAIPEESLVFLGNSLPLREWNLAATRDRNHSLCFANRGANGIDGEIASFLGLSEGREESWGVFGDLTALYDLNAPRFLSQLSKGRRRIVVINNGGGRIFSRLPAMEDLPTEEKAVTENHHEIRFSAWAEMWGMDYVSWQGGESFPAIEGDSVVLEVRPDEDATEAFWNGWK